MSDGQNVSIESLKSFIELNNQISSNFDDLNAMLVSIVRQVMAFVRCASCSVLIYENPEKSIIVSGSSSSVQVKYVPVEKGSIASWVMEHRQTVIINDPAGDSFFSATHNLHLPKNMMASPVVFDADCFGVIELFNRADGGFDDDDVSLVELLGKSAGISYKRFFLYSQKKDLISLYEKNSWSMKNESLPFIGNSPMIRDIEKAVDEISGADSCVLISGENGSGKSYVAGKMHEKSRRKDKTFIKISCTGKSQDFLDEEIFGQDGAVSKAEGGTLVLDEVANLSPDLQEKLFKILKYGEFIPRNTGIQKKCDVRIFALTCRDLGSMVKSGRFSERLYYLLDMLPLNVPPLRKHPSDILLLADFFMEKYSRAFKKNLEGFSSDAAAMLSEYQWPGNIPELENAVMGACIKSGSVLLKSGNFSGICPDAGFYTESFTKESAESSGLSGDRTLRTAVNGFKKEYVKKILREENWNQSAASRVLDVQRTYVTKLIADLGIKRGDD